ncbi:4-phosphoerythronate dehydrogenase PdxB [Halomonas sp. DP8Y7-1]|uniref:4-phosphoerythronate dehydrogenase PdxB n=1 Tax=Halomonas sp. DP8Y7-1 TaxID=2859078 RepID=UPI001C97C120|nr:4-phosphoerythronate dehydrogenase PdxB [Halomonas sp. DP8Y7-1]MBY6029482.1 4-phosphoerythronate dehydrogenase PdxB [Halomonas sp. DP8Y7-1]
MKIVVDANVPAADACFGPLGEVVRVPGREINAHHLADASALVIRSITQVDEALINQARSLGSPLSFVGSCTIGTDHVSLEALASSGIAFASAPGCNAEPVVDYVLSALALACERRAESLLDKRVGILGVGNVGGRLAARLAAMGVAHELCDPPRSDREGQQGFVDLDTLIERCDVLCLHTPLVKEGAHATRHLLDAGRIEALKPGSLLLNAGRGDCVDGQALSARLARDNDMTALLDVWEREPAIDLTLARQVMLGTPHIAGHSLEGKLRGTHQIYQALVEHLGVDEVVTLQELLPPPALARMTWQRALPVEEVLRACMRAVYEPRRDHDRLAQALATSSPAQGFDQCRASYPLRREFSTLSVELTGEAQRLAKVLSGAGFRIV